MPEGTVNVGTSSYIPEGIQSPQGGAVTEAPPVNPEGVAATSQVEVATLCNQMLVESNRLSREQFETYQREVNMYHARMTATQERMTTIILDDNKAIEALKVQIIALDAAKTQEVAEDVMCPGRQTPREVHGIVRTPA